MGPVSPQMMIMRIALAKVQALPSTIDAMPCKNPKGIAGYAKEFLRFFVVLKGFLLRFHRHNILVGQAQVGSSAYTCRARAAPHIRRPATECPLTTESETE